MNSDGNSMPKMLTNAVNAFLPKSSGTPFTTFRDSVAGGLPDFSPDISQCGRSNFQGPARSPPNRKYEDKLAVSPGAAPAIHRRGQGGGFEDKFAPAVAHPSNLIKRKAGLTMEAPKMKRCRGSAEHNHKDKTGNANGIEKQGFIHVRARRGQATDSHSLAERARREKINKRMTALRNLVPSCYQATGNAVVLDEIINYIKSLQNQVESLSMKLTVASQGYNFCVEMEKETPMPMDECGITAMAAPFAEEATAPSDYCIARSESLDAPRASFMLGTTLGDELPFGIGLPDANQWDFELQRRFQDGHLLPWN